jgi:hypothetical protein
MTSMQKFGSLKIIKTWTKSNMWLSQLPITLLQGSIKNPEYHPSSGQGGTSSNASDLYLGHVRFGSQQGHHISWLRFSVVLCSPSKQILGHCLSPLKSNGSICTICFNILKLCILPTVCVCVYRMILTINSDCLPKNGNQLDFVVEM